jgi:hypothetical protein
VWGCPPPPSRGKGSLPSLLCIFFFYLLVYYSVLFSFFSQGGGQSVQGAMLICPREYCMPLICSPGGLQAG